MKILRFILAILLPPLAVWNRGCVTVMLVGIISGIIWFFAYLNNVLLLAYWLPGIAVALFMVLPELIRTPAPTEDRSQDIVGTAASFKQQALPGEMPTTRTQQAAPKSDIPPPQSAGPASGPPKPPWED